VVPDVFKLAYITPLLKKSDLDPAAVTSYRPISNLPMLSKLLERLIAQQMLDYLVEGWSTARNTVSLSCLSLNRDRCSQSTVGHLVGGGWG